LDQTARWILRECDVYEGCATHVVELAKQAGIVMVAAGGPFPIVRIPTTATYGSRRPSLN